MNKNLITLFLALILTSISAKGVEGGLRAGLITCWPGPEVYELCGHEALRIHGTDPQGIAVDSVWNYGVFDFNAPNFIYRFVKGETDYMVESYPFQWFMPQYVYRGSRVVEQELNLTDEETARLLKLLQINALPQNRTYRYNYVRDNCSTRVADMIDSAVFPRKIIYPEEVSYSSFREAMRYYHRNYPWYQFGIDLALGSGIDAPISSREEIFSPILFEQKMEKAHFEDGTPLVSRQQVLYPGLNPAGDAILSLTPWILTPMAVALLILIISLVLAICVVLPKISSCRGLILTYKIWMSIFFGLLGLAGCVIWFLVFVSTHDSTSPNLLSLWANPLQFVLAICIWWRKTMPVARAMAFCNVVIMILLATIWPFQVQSANPAVFPLWGATFALSAAYAIISGKTSYKY